MSARLVIKRTRPFWFLLASSAILTYTSYDYFSSSHDAAILAMDGLHTSRGQAEEIEEIRNRPILATTVIEEVGSLTRRLTTARNAAAIDPQASDLVDPQSPVRLGDSAYRQRPVAIDLRGLKLSQVVRFTDALTDRDDGMWVNQIRLTPVRSESSESDTELWNVELVLTQVNYSPKSQ